MDSQTELLISFRKFAYRNYKSEFTNGYHVSA